MKLRNLSIFIVVLLVFDQVLKIWIKTHMCLGESITVIPDWFQLRFIENNGAAFGMHLSFGGEFDWGKILLSLFRIVLIGLLIYYVWYLARKRSGVPKGVFISLAMVVAGAIGNMLDSAFYGLIFSASTPISPAHLGDGYAPFLMGKVVDMFYFPLFRWESIPQWLSFLVDENYYFFGPIFNLADTYISVAVVMLIFHYKFFQD